MRTQHEKLKVEKPCLQLCATLEAQGVISEYRKLDAQDRMHIVGSPDIEIRYIMGNTLYLLQCECKRPDGGTQRTKQKEYENKYSHCSNVHYVIVRSSDELRRIIYDFTGKRIKDSEEIKNIDFP